MKLTRAWSWLVLVPSLCGATSFITNPDERKKIEEAIPDKAIVNPIKPRRLLIFTLNVGYGGHPSIAYANEAFTLMGKKTGAFETTVSNDPAVFEKASLSQFDAVFFNNTVGNCFTNASLRQNLVEFVTGGGGLMGVHGTTVAFTQWPGATEDWPEFGYMIGARGANHKDSTEPVWMKPDDATHPLNSVFGGQALEYRDEFFRVHDPYSRKRLRILLSIDTQKTDPNQGAPRGNCFREDNDYALSWIRNYGRGRVFYFTVAHNPYVFWDRTMLRYYFGALQFILGDLPAPTLPSAYLTDAARAGEKLGWKLGVEASTFSESTFFEAINKTARLGLPYIGGLGVQPVSKDIPRNFDAELSDAELQAIRLKLEDSGLRLLTYYIQDIPGNESGCRKIFEFGRKMGIETFIAEPKPEALDMVEKLANQYGINVALRNRDPKTSPNYWNPEGILKVCRGRSAHLGACANLGNWMRSGVDPVHAVRRLKERLITVQMHDLDTRSAEGQDVPWGTGAGRSREFLQALKTLKLRPTMIGIEFSGDRLESMPKVTQCIEFYNANTLNLAGTQKPAQP
jgi:sugar phosphate isomerase/epimerase/type 1 glutamine amidotransferase